MTKLSDEKKLLKNIQETIDEKISPSLAMHGGGIEIVELKSKKKGYDLKVRLQGACAGCGAATITLQYLVQETIDEEFPKDNIDIVPVS